MAYNITYSPEKQKLYPLLSAKRKRQRCIVAGICIFAALLAILFGPIGNNLYQQIKTESMHLAEDAAVVFCDELSAGRSVYNALQEYCRYILDGANES